MDTFWVLNAANSRYYRDRATIVCETPHLYLYVQNSVHVGSRRACKSARLFEHHTYPTDRASFGSEWIPGVDDDPHVTLFYGHVPGVAGYFSDEDEYPTSVNRFSNEREMMFISSDATSVGNSDFDSTVAHEFQHMIHWHVHAQDEAWDNEGASMLAQVINGYSADGVDQSYAADPVQLDSWSDGYNSPNYGAGFLWMDYLYEHFGGSFIHEMLADRHYSGIALARHVLRERVGLPLSQVFGNWIVANYLNDRSAGPQYGYRNSSIRVPAMATLSGPTASYAGRLHPYAPLYLRLKHTGSSRTYHFHASPTIPVIAAGHTAPFWWSNRCDFCDTSMTRSVNLRKLTNPILTFDAWYEIESGYDYAYVEASTDSGATWHTLRSSITTKANPNGSNIGNGITGRSARVAGSRHGWVPVKVHLRRYHGRRILLRFEYVTDDEFNGQSLAIKNISVGGTHLGHKVGDTAWRLSGFVPVTRNVLPMQWSIRLITFPKDGPPRIKAISVNSDGNASISVHPSTGTERAALAIFAQAPKTTLTARVHITS